MCQMICTEVAASREVLPGRQDLPKQQFVMHVLSAGKDFRRKVNLRDVFLK